MKMQKYADATLHDLVRVIYASECLYATMAEFPSDPAAWEEDMNYFDTCIEACPGTNAYYNKACQKGGE